MQHRVDSLMEALTNTAIGFLCSMALQIVLVWAYDVHMAASTQVQFVAWFTGLSIARQYVLRRIFNGRSPWSAIKGAMGK